MAAEDKTAVIYQYIQLPRTVSDMEERLKYNRRTIQRILDNGVTKSLVIKTKDWPPKYVRTKVPIPEPITVVSIDEPLNTTRTREIYNLLMSDKEINNPVLVSVRDSILLATGTKGGDFTLNALIVFLSDTLNAVKIINKEQKR